MRFLFSDIRDAPRALCHYRTLESDRLGVRSPEAPGAAAAGDTAAVPRRPPGRTLRPGISACVLADADRFPRVRLDRRGHPDPARQPVADPGPTDVDSVALRQRPQQMHAVLGKHGDEQVRPDAVLLHGRDRPQADLALQDAEGRFDLVQPPVRFREARHVPIGMARA